MEIKIKLQVWTELEISKEVIERLINENLNKKLDQYLNKFDKDWAVWLLDINVDKNKKWLFNGKVQANLDGESYRAEREDYKKLDDLINHLFEHLKLQLSD